MAAQDDSLARDGEQQKRDDSLAKAVPSRNPIPLSASQEAQVRDVFYARVRSRCTDEIKGEPGFLPPVTRNLSVWVNVANTSG